MTERAPIEDPDGQAEEWSGERLRAFRQALSARRERQARGGRLFALALIATVAGGVVLRAPEVWWMPATGAIALAAIAFRLVNWRCPSCGETLPSRRSASVCLGCGAPLE